MDQSLTSVRARPILLDKSTVPRGQMLPVCQDQFISASFQIMEDNCINKQSAFRGFSSSSFTQSAFSRMLPEIGPVSSLSQMPCDATSSQIDLNAANFTETYPTEELNCAFRNVDSLIEHRESQLIDQCAWGDIENLQNQKLIAMSQNQTSTPCSSDPILGDGTNSHLEVACNSYAQGAISSSNASSPQWLDLFLDSRGNLCFPDATLEESVFTTEPGPI